MKLTGNNHWPLLTIWLDFKGQGHSRPKYVLAKTSTSTLGVRICLLL